MSDLAERLRKQVGDDHVRGCQGRQYACSCGYDISTEGLLEMAAARIEQLEAALRAITIRCEEGDKKSDWLPTISNIARAALDQSSPPSATE